MYALEVKPNDVIEIEIIKISEFTVGNYWPNDHYIAKIINMDLNDYRKVTTQNLNLQLRNFPSYLNDYMHLYAQNLDEATRWKEWIESQLVLRRLVKKD